jgi:hypothetical protein
MLLAAGLPFSSEAKSYSSGGGRSYSSHSSGSGGSHSFGGSSRSSGFGSSGNRSSSSSSRSSNSSAGGSKSFSAGSGKSYSAGSRSSDDNRHGYSSSKSYSSGAGHLFKPGSADGTSGTIPAREPAGKSSGFSFDTAAARAKKEEASQREFRQFKDSQIPKPSVADNTTRPGAGASGSYGGKPPLASNPSSYGSTVYIPDRGILVSRPVRIRTVFYPYYSRPVVVYHDPYNSLFWWWLLDRSLDDRAGWAYHHRYDMDPYRYQALMATDQQLESRVAQLEAQQVQRDPNYVPQGVSQDLMYSDRYVAHAYSNRPTMAGAIAFWVFAVPLAGGFCVFFIWLIWFKRWQTAT